MTDIIFDRIKDGLLAMDPVEWCQKHLTLEGKPYRINGNGYKPLADIARTIGMKALEKGGLPIVICKGRQIGLTILCAALEMYFMGSGVFGNGHNPPIRIIHCFPQLELANAYSKVKLNSMINNSIVISDKPIKGQKAKSFMQNMLDRSSDSNDSLNFKQFQGGNHMFIESIGLDGNRMMGKSTDILFADEVQKMPALGLGNSTKTLTKANYGSVGKGVQVYFGTPLQRGSMFSDMWSESSQQFYHLGCEKCKKHFPLFTQNSNEWEEIWLYGFTVRCKHCGFEQDKSEAVERGKWIASKDLGECKYIGFHLNQLYNPEYTKERIMDEKPGHSATNTERTYQNEVLGNFWSGETGIISPDEIRDICGDPERKFRATITPDDGEMVFLGIDIGAKNDIEQLIDRPKIAEQGQSYSTAVIITINGSQRITIERAEKFKRNDFASKKETINYFMRKYSVNLGVIDLGFTGDLSEVLQTEWGDKFLSSTSSHRVNDHIKFNDSIFPKVITFEKDFWIAEMYEQMRKGNIRFPLGDYEKIAWLIQHCTNMEIKPSISRSGEVTPKYVKSGPNDGFMALLNAYLAYKFYVSNGFSIKHPSMMNNSPKRRPPVVVGYLPGL
jgi:hypothetical protein